MLQVMYDILFKPSSSNDVGTMCSNMNAVNNVNAKTKNVLDNFNSCKSFVNLENVAYISAATMHHFQMDTIDDKAESFIPPFLLSANKRERRIWLHKQVQCILQKHVLNDQQEFLDRLQHKLPDANEPQ